MLTTTAYDSGTMLLEIALMIVGILIILVSIASVGVSIWLTIKYIGFNNQQNSANMTGEQLARTLLDRNGLEKIKVKTSGSVMFGNSYSHYFHKIRLRRGIYKKTSLTSLGIATQKVCLAVLDKDEDPDMKKRVKLTPIVTFGPFAFVPLVLIGFVLDVLILNGTGAGIITFSILAFLIYGLSIWLSVKTLVSEKKAQEMSYEVLRQNNLATEEEIAKLAELFKLYNIEYINNIVLSSLELIYDVLRFILKSKLDRD